MRTLLTRIHSRCGALRPVLLPTTLFIAVLAAAEIPGNPSGNFAHFVTRQQDRLMEGEKEFRFISVNMPDSLQLISNYRFDGDFSTTRYRLPDDYELRDCVRTVRQLGGQVIRTFVITCRRDADPLFAFNVATEPVVPNEAALRVLDRLLHICHEEGVRLIIPLVAYNSSVRGDWHTYGDDFWTVGSTANRKFKDVVRQVLTRVNTFTGQRYLDDKAILGWQTGNELVIGDDANRRAWLHDFAAYFKSLDSNHLLIDGRNRPDDVYERYEEFLSDPNIDAVSYHTYRNLPVADSPVGTLRLIRELTRGKKVLLVTEIAMYTPAPVLRELLDGIIADHAVSGANWWGLRFRNRDGGFYKHSDKNSEFEDLNWPGFTRPPELPAAIDTERQLLDIITEHAWKIRGVPVPAPAVPAAPHLLAIPDQGHIAWQGATGTRSYSVQRAESTDGPWLDISDGLTDNLISYAPQYCDSTVTPGAAYYYRVIARNEAGASAASNVVGPVAVKQLWLVDELFDLKQAAPESRNLRIDQAYAHSSYLEDIALAVRADPTQSAELIYRRAQPIREFTATVYEAQVVPRVFVLGSKSSRREIQPEITSYDGGKRRRLSLRLAGDETALLIELPAQAADRQAIGRVEISTESAR